MFEELATNYPDSRYAPEANFHVAELHYADKRYDEAIENYRLCFENSDNPQHAEMAIYKIGWCQYRQREFGDAESFVSSANREVRKRRIQNGRAVHDRRVVVLRQG